MTEIEVAIDNYLHGRRVRGEITVTTAEHFRQRLVSLAGWFGNRPLVELDGAAVDRWRDGLGHLAPESGRAYRSAVATFLDWLNDPGRWDAPSDDMAALESWRWRPEDSAAEGGRS